MAALGDVVQVILNPTRYPDFRGQAAGPYAGIVSAVYADGTIDVNVMTPGSGILALCSIPPTGQTTPDSEASYH
ncbi:MAG TPA: hypothetical protein VMW56_22755 [Candidatus Margulisiibacteriota bacterium]|nr:hypothetical protein [Candidatus Margulisiibacteriota bacterium]